MTFDDLPRDLAPEALWLRPVGLARGAARDAALEAGALPVQGGAAAFAVEAVALHGAREVAALGPLAALVAWATTRGAAMAARVAALTAALGAARPDWAGLDLATPRLMGVVNVTPDSFSDGGDRFDAAAAIAAGKAMLAAGADIVDVGGESTRPGSAAPGPDEERRRIEPVVSALAEAGALVSIDTRHAEVMGAALDRGARIVNDVTALTHDAAALPLVAKRGAALVLMHMQGTPETMQLAPRYDSAPVEVTEYLASRVAACAAAGIPAARILVDPGIGFGKTLAHNLAILERLALLHGTGCGVLLGVSRKSFVEKIAGPTPPKARLPGSLAAALAGLKEGAQVLRVHDVAETRQAMLVWRAATEGRH